jgi:phasin family protein
MSNTSTKAKASAAKADVTKDFENLMTTNHKSLQDAFKTGADAAEQAFLSGNEAFKSTYANALKEGKAQLEKAAKTLGETSLFDAEGAEPFITAGTAAAMKSEKINAEMIDFGTARVTEYFSATRSVFAADDMQKAIELQSEFARTSVQTYVSEAGKLNAMLVDATKSLMEPFGTQYAASMDKFLNRA